VTIPTSSPPATLRLRPGFPVLRRDADSLQVGCRRPWAVRLPDRPSVRRLLDALEAGQDHGRLDDDARLALDRLLAARLVVLGTPDAAGEPHAAELLLFGDDARRRRDARRTSAIGVLAEPAAATGLTELLETAGLTVDEETAGTWLVLAAGPARRSLVDPLVQAGVPHLLVEGVGPRRRVGPFVVPGRTACLRCVDAHHGDIDPRRATVLHQLEELPPTPLTDPDPCLVQLALGWAMRDVVRVLDGSPPSLRSATVTVTEDLEVTRRDWLRHPHCGCAWG